MNVEQTNAHRFSAMDFHRASASRSQDGFGSLLDALASPTKLNKAAKGSADAVGAAQGRSEHSRKDIARESKDADNPKAKHRAAGSEEADAKQESADVGSGGQASRADASKPTGEGRGDREGRADGRATRGEAKGQAEGAAGGAQASGKSAAEGGAAGGEAVSPSRESGSRVEQGSQANGGTGRGDGGAPAAGGDEAARIDRLVREAGQQVRRTDAEASTKAASAGEALAGNRATSAASVQADARMAGIAGDGNAAPPRQGGQSADSQSQGRQGNGEAQRQAAGEAVKTSDAKSPSLFGIDAARARAAEAAKAAGSASGSETTMGGTTATMQTAGANPVNMAGSTPGADLLAQAASPTSPSGGESAPGASTQANAQTANTASAWSVMNAGDLPDADAQRIAGRALSGLRGAINQQGGTVTLQLNPPELGALRIQVRLSAGAVTATFEATHSGVNQLLQQHMASLRQALEGQGLHVESLQVQSPASSSQSNQAQTQNQDQSSQQQAHQSAGDGRSRGSFDQSGEQSGDPADGDDGSDASFERELLDLVA